MRSTQEKHRNCPKAGGESGEQAGLQAAGGTVDNVEVWGRRRLAYEIQKKAEGIYVVVNLTAEPAVVKELDRQYTLNEQIMRTKVIRPDPKA